MMLDHDTFLTGKMLIATPSLGDSRFSRSLIYVADHNERHAMGIVVNKAMGELTLMDLLDQLSIPATIRTPDRLVLEGGPVGRDRGFVLHSDDYFLEDATLVGRGGVSLTATKEVLEAIAADDGAPERAVLALGYAGWGPGQLEAEIADNSWLICEATEQFVFGDDLEAKWAGALASIGADAGRLSGLSGTA
ncbi:MAG: YqgE/AlgH family protein [Maricaulaceae bacterium]